MVYFAFTYPYTYKELQQCLGRLERKHANGSNSFVALQQLPDSTIYFHRWDIKFYFSLLTENSNEGSSPQRVLKVGG